jgi:hypothetical protein
MDYAPGRPTSVGSVPCMSPTHRLSVCLLLGLLLPVCGQTVATVPAATGPGAKPTTPAATVPGSAAGAAVGGAPRVFVPSLPRTSYSRYPWKTNIVATVFWIGEQPTENNPTPNDKSSWDTQWMQNFGGYDDPDPTKRTLNYTPAAFVPKQNPFYIALPYNDLVDYNTTKQDAYTRIPWFKQRFTRPGKTVLKGQWLAIRYGNRVCYAQWEDCGPFLTDDVNYVFGDARPLNTSNQGAGLDISPAVRDYLGLKSGAKVDWRFCDVNEVGDGPWRTFGTNNPFVRAKSSEQAQIRSRLEELRRMRDEYFRQYGSGR